MAFEATLPHVMRAAGAFLWLPLGIWLLARATHGTREWWLGASLVPISLAILLPNVLVMEVPIDPRKVAAAEVFATIAFLGGAATLAQLLRREDHGRRFLWLGGIAAALAGMGVAMAILSQAGGVGPLGAQAAHSVSDNASSVVAITLLAAVGAHFAHASTRADHTADDARVRGLAWVASALCMFPGVFASGLIDAIDPSAPTPKTPLQLVAGLALATPVLVALVLLMRVRDGLGRRPAAVLFGVILVGATAGFFIPGDLGSRGIARTIAFGIMAYAFLATGLLPHASTPSSARRGVALTGALSALLIVAQVAQNFLSAQYGLLMGGVVAGALLVAARPIERALEAKQAPRGPAAIDDDRASSYRAALRRYLRDGIVTREEEVELARLARHLGIPHEETVRIRHAVEDERGGGAR